ncbi:FAD-binding protein [Isoptericola variabilis]|uniref:FAD-binding protein n=1 Tax=Isoptericola variabilis TaxID=139208 RepID=UPI0021BD41D1|nr:FAD-binding protein [Isoptericola variabilis]
MHLNWAGNLTYTAREVARPTTLDELADVLARADKVRALGSRHSFNDVADTPGVHVQVDALDDGNGLRPGRYWVTEDGLVVLASEAGAVDLDPATGVASVTAGLRYGDIMRTLHAEGRALATMASLPHISVAGAVATATHGSGDATRSLAGAVVGLELMTPDGGRHRLVRGDADFAGAVVSLGALGVVTRVDLETEPAYEVRQDVALDLPWDTLLERFDDVTGAAYSVSVFTGWDEPAARHVWFKSRVDGGVVAGDDGRPDALRHLRWATAPQHPVPGVDPVACTEQLGVPGPWYDRLSHFRLEFTPSAGAELQSEYLLPRRNAVAAVEAMRRLGPVVAPHLLTSEIRTIAADDLWLSPFDEDSVGFHFTWLQHDAEVRAVLPRIEEALLPLGARPHWGKLFAVGLPDVAATYPRFADFRALAERMDPAGKLRGGYVERLLG